MTVVNLSPEEFAEVGALGLKRLILASRSGRLGVHGFRQDDIGRRYAADVEGTVSEYAVAKYRDVPFAPAIGRLDTHEGDVDGLQVRSSTLPGARLILHDSDSDLDWFVLVTGCFGTYRLRGFLRGEEGKRAEFLRELEPGRAACYAVPQTRLRPIQELEWARSRA